MRIIHLLAYAMIASGSIAQRVVHVLVPLCDNEHQGIVPVPKTLGNGTDLDHNLYWGAAYGVRTWFDRSSAWKRVSSVNDPRAHVLQQCIWKHAQENVYVVADAYHGAFIMNTVADLMSYAGGSEKGDLVANGTTLRTGGGSDLLAYCGHDALMEHTLTARAEPASTTGRDVIVLACASKTYFANGLKDRGAYPLLWTTGLMSPEAYTLDAALQGWVAKEGSERIRERAAQAYAKWQKCSIGAARRLVVSGW